MIERQLPYDRQFLMAIVMGVETYPEFIKWVRASRCRRTALPASPRRTAPDGGADSLEADVIVGHRLFSASVRASLVSTNQNRIQIRYLSGPIRDLKSVWTFDDIPDATVVGVGNEDRSQPSCHVRVTVDLDPGMFLAPAINALFERGMERLVEAFESRAFELHGRAVQAAKPDQV